MKMVILITLTILTLTSTGRPEDRLPLQTEILLQKLTEWEDQEKSALTKRVQIKRNEVALLLKQHLKKATTSGDLKTANLIQSKINILTPQVAVTDKKPAKPTRKDIKSQIVGHKWKLSGAAQYIVEVEFLSNGNVVAVGRDEKTFEHKWEITNGVLQYGYFLKGKPIWSEVEVSKRGNEISFTKSGQFYEYKKLK
ncbi:MAG: hypothetical protein GXP30_02440 [Verrucomicrobia bacterium]|nr:hypothetical protein [Verrucomicrobiota bacterium]